MDKTSDMLEGESLKYDVDKIQVAGSRPCRQRRALLVINYSLLWRSLLFIDYKLYFLL